MSKRNIGGTRGCWMKTNRVIAEETARMLETGYQHGTARVFQRPESTLFPYNRPNPFKRLPKAEELNTPEAIRMRNDEKLARTCMAAVQVSPTFGCKNRVVEKAVLFKRDRDVNDFNHSCSGEYKRSRRSRSHSRSNVMESREMRQLRSDVRAGKRENIKEPAYSHWA